MLFANTIAKVWNGARDYSSKYFQRRRDKGAFYEEKKSLQEVKDLPGINLNCSRKVVQDCDISAYREKINAEIERSRREINRANSLWNVVFSPYERERTIEKSEASISRMYQILDNLNSIADKLYDKYSLEVEKRRETKRAVIDEDFYITHRAVRDLDEIVYRRGDISEYVTEEAREFTPYPKAKIGQLMGVVYQQLAASDSKLMAALNSYARDAASSDNLNLTGLIKYIQSDKEGYVKNVIKKRLSEYDEISLYNPDMVDALRESVTEEIRGRLIKAKRGKVRTELAFAGHIGI